VLPMFLGLTKVALRAVGTTGSLNSWPTLPEMFHLAFLDCIQMKEALLERVWFFQLTDLNNCKTVTLSRLQLPRPIDSGSSILSTALLKSLSIEDYDRDTYAITGRWVQTLSLHSLRLSLPSESAELDALRIPEFLTLCPNTLINLELDFKNKRMVLFIILFFIPKAEWYSAPVRSSHNFSATAELESQINMAAPATFSKFQELEKLTISSELRFLYSGVRRRTSPEPRWTLHSAIPSIKLFAMTAPSSLKRLTLNFHVFFSAGCRRLPDPDVLWSSLATLVAECSALSIKVEVKTRCETQGSERIPPGMMHASFAGSTQLMQYRDMGVLVIGLDVAGTQPLAQKEETTSNLLPSTSSTSLKRGRS